MRVKAAGECNMGVVQAHMARVRCHDVSFWPRVGRRDTITCLALDKGSVTPISLPSLATGRAVVVALLLWLGTGFVLFQLGPYAELRELAPGLAPLDERMGYAWTDVQVYFAILGESGRSLYRLFLIADSGNAILMASAVTLLLAFLTTRLGLGGTRVSLVAFIPVAGGALDLLENALLLVMLDRFPEIAESLAGIASITTASKLVTSLAGAAAVVAGLTGWAVKALRRSD